MWPTKQGHFVANKRNRPLCGQQKQATLWPIEETGHFVAKDQHKRMNFGRWKLLLISNLTDEGLEELKVKTASSKQCILN